MTDSKGGVGASQYGSYMGMAQIYRLDSAIMPNGQLAYVIVDREDEIHVASSWLLSLTELGRSPLTVMHYGSRVAGFLNWIAGTVDWRSTTLAHLVLWRRTLAVGGARSEKTVTLWMIALRSFISWADAHGLMTNDIASKMTQTKYFARGTAAGGEHGAYRAVTSPRLRGSAGPASETRVEWIDDARARDELEALVLPNRDRLLVDIFLRTGIRAGEALSLFTADLHFGGGSRGAGCVLRDPHFHVRTSNPVTNGARAKGVARTVFVDQAMVDLYIDYVLERQVLLGADDRSPHAFVNVYTNGTRKGLAMTYSGIRKIIQRCARSIDFPMSGPHILRHTFATRLSRGIDCVAQPIEVVQAMLGHRSRSSTTIYLHDLEAAMRKAVESLAPRTLGPRTLPNV